MKTIKDEIYEVIFESNTKAGKYFDLFLIVCIVFSVVIVMLDSVESIRSDHGALLNDLEWFFTILFSVEYILRLYSIGNSFQYAISFFGIVDLLSILPTYISLLVPGTQYLLVVRVIRVLRIFRILKIVKYIGEANLLMYALKESRRKISLFLFTVLTLVIVFGSVMYLIENSQNEAFSSIPMSVYWAIVTMTTVGYGDISPVTPLGRSIASFVMVVGYSIIAIPTGIFTMEISKIRNKSLSHRVCPSCSFEGHDDDADFCKLCGHNLSD